MQLPKIKGMKALTVSLIAASALVFVVILVVYTGASRRAEDPETEDTESTQSESGESLPNPPADLGYDETVVPSESTDPETQKPAESTTAPEVETTVYSLSFTSNGDGTCYVSGLGTYRSTEVEIPTLNPSGEIVTGIGKYAFYNCSSIVRISLPSTLRSIGEYAFLGCSSLVEITVSSGNTAFQSVDGILYSRDGSRLICCPAMRGKTSCTLSSAVTVIECGAFSGVQNLKTVYYKGSAADWTEINIYAKNELLDSIRLVCNYSDK